MANSLLVRDFHKVYRELRYANEGAIRLSEIEHNAYVNRLTVEITHYDAYRSVNYKTNPDTTHWGYLTAFKGSSVTENLPVKFAKQRVFEQINQSIWNYHQSTETTEIQRRMAEMAANSVLQSGLLGDASNFLVGVVLEAVDWLGGEFDQAKAWLLGWEYSGNAPSGLSVSDYTAFPIASPFPDVWKFKADIPVSFLFRLESWYLVNPAVYITANPTDSSDETEGENEYPEPAQGDGDGDSQEFPGSSPNDPENDPRDGGQKPAAPILPLQSYTWNGTISGTAINASAQPESVSYPFTFTATGNQSPFTTTVTGNVIVFSGGEPWYDGVFLFDRFGQNIGTFFAGTGWRSGSVSVNATVSG